MDVPTEWDGKAFHAGADRGRGQRMPAYGVAAGALVAAGVAVVPILASTGPPVWAGCPLLPAINHVWPQLSRWSAWHRTGGSWCSRPSPPAAPCWWRIVTRELQVVLLRMVGVRLSAQQAVKYVPIAGRGPVGRAQLRGAAPRLRAAHPPMHADL